MTSTAVKAVSRVRASEANDVLREVRGAHQSLQLCFGELDKVLSAHRLNPGALTSVRLRLAGIRLSRGPLIVRISELLDGNVTEAEAKMLQDLRSSHYRMLQIATVHTGKWTLETIARNWPEYRRETRELVRRWITKAEREQRLILPLVERCANQLS